MQKNGLSTKLMGIFTIFCLISYSLASPAHSFIINPFPNENIIGDIMGVIGLIAITYYGIEGVKLILQKYNQEGWIKSTDVNVKHIIIGENIFVKSKSILYLHPNLNSAWISTFNATMEGTVLEVSNNVDGKWYKIKIRK